MQILGPMARCLFLCLPLLPACVPAQAGEWTVFTRENSGLPDNNVLSLLVTPEGGLWIGTRFEGLAFLDGTMWSYFKPPAPPGAKGLWGGELQGPQAQAIYDLALDSTGALWVGTKVHGLLRFDGSTWTRYDTVNSDLPDNYAWSLLIDGENRLWVGTRYGGVAVFDGGSWVIYNSHNSPLPSDDVGCLAIDSKQRIWIGTRRGLVVMEGSEWRVYTTANSGLPCDHVEAIALDREDVAWLGTFGGGLARFEEQKQFWHVYRHATSGLPSDSIYSLSVGPDGTVWAGTFSAGLAAFERRGWTVFNSHNSPVPHDLIYETATDKGGALWVATTLGLARYRREAGDVGHLGLTPMPVDFSLSAVHPNPFLHGIRLSFSLPRTAQIKLAVFDLGGRQVCSLLSGLLHSGTYQVWWDGRDEHGVQVPAGLYLAQLAGAGQLCQVRMVRLR